MTWTHTSRGRALDLLDPQPDDVDLAEIALALGNQCRYNGCVLRFYSVAEHSVLISEALERGGCARELQLGGLLHDAAEAYTGDITWPMQAVLFDGEYGRQPRLRYKAVQSRLGALIAAKAGIDPCYLHDDLVRHADLRILLDEREVLLAGRPRPWDIEGLAPLGVTITGWLPDEARQRWLDRARALGVEVAL
jgi:hypothetical protein